MKKINLLYWIFTGLYAAVIILTSVSGLLSKPEAVDMIVNKMHYPAYFLPFLSAAKILGGIALLVPGFNRIKEWAYAGLFFDLIAAVYSFIAIGLSAMQWLPVLIFFIVLGGSYFLYHKRLKALALQGGK